MPNRIVLIHLGAHRTGTKYLQSVFAENRQTLAQCNIRFVSIHEHPRLRKAVLRSRHALRDGKAQLFEKEFAGVVAFLSKHLRDHADENLLFSYEGFMGDLSLRRSGELYRGHAALLRKVMQIFQGERVHGAFSLREYGAFVESGYKYLAQTGLRQNFHRYVEGIELDALSWLPVVRTLEKTFGNELSLWTFEDFARSPGALLSWLFERGYGKDPKLVKIPHEPRNASISRSALPALLLFNRLIPVHRKGSNRLYRLLLWLFPAGKFGSPQLLDESTRRRLRKNYLRDLQTIRTEVPGCYCLSSDE